jgi:uncharacterized protein
VKEPTELEQLVSLVARNPGEAARRLRERSDRTPGTGPLSHLAMLRFDAARHGVTGPLTGAGALARTLIESGTPVDGLPEDPETPLITAASYGDAEVARVLLDAGADLDSTASPDAGGVRGGTALLHAAVFGMTAVLDLLLAAGARVGSLSEAAAAGTVTGWLTADTPPLDRVRALAMAADHERLAVIDQLLEARTPIDAEDTHYRRQALRLAATRGRTRSVAHLLSRGADPQHRDPFTHRTALEWCRELGGGTAVEALLTA